VADSNFAVLARFLGEVRAHPQAPALQDEQGHLSYAELLARAHTSAGKLAAEGAGAGSRVAVECGYGRDYVIALLAVWLLGATPVPLDPAFPAERRIFQIRQAGCDTAVTSPASDGVTAGEVAGHEPAGQGEANAPAYIMFTSGSTGRPKGVMVEHEALAGLLDCLAGWIGFGQGDRMAVHTNTTFDFSMLETVLPLTVGGCLAVAPARSARNPEILGKWLLSRPVDAAIFTPSQLRLLLPFLARRRAFGQLVSGGEALTAALAQELPAVCDVLWNGYGPTEATILAVCSILSPPWEDPMPIGHPVDGLQAQVLDEALRPVPAGNLGELCLSGPLLARGYVGDPEQTALAFVTGPDGERTYRTGDIVEVRPDGQFAYHGRKDDQVKIRGHRVELGEIEAAAQRHPSVGHAAAVTCAGGGDQSDLYLVIAAAPGCEPAPGAVREHLAGLLPDYMLPRRVLYVSDLPMNTSGKIDRQAVRKHVETHPT
jgi:amino acid adenylation domain-containing protein